MSPASGMLLSLLAFSAGVVLTLLLRLGRSPTQTAVLLILLWLAMNLPATMYIWTRFAMNLTVGLSPVLVIQYYLVLNIGLTVLVFALLRTNFAITFYFVFVLFALYNLSLMVYAFLQLV